MTAVPVSVAISATRAADQAAVFDMSHLDNPRRPAHLLLVIAAIALAAVTYALYADVYRDVFSDRAQATFCIMYGIVSAVWILCKATRPGPINWLSPDVMFWVMFTLFHVPFVVLYLIGLADFNDTIFYSPASANRAMCVVVLSLIGFIVGYELGAVGRSQPAVFEPAVRMPETLMRSAGALVIVTVIAGVLVLVIGLGESIGQLGYSGYRRMERYVGPEMQRLIQLIVGIMVPMTATLYVIASLFHRRRVFTGFVVPSVILAVAGFFALLGARTEAAHMLIPLILGRHYFRKPLKLRIGFPLFALAILAFGFIGIARGASSLAPGDLIRAYTDFRDETGVNPFVAALAETGSSVKTVNVACTYMPSTESHWYGKSLRDAAFKIIPMPVAGLRTDLHVPGGWVTRAATGKSGYETAGWGSSIATEGYLNFGLLGAGFFLMAVGFTYRRIYDALLRRPTYLKACLMMSALAALAFWCRNESQFFFRPVLWTLLLAWLMWSVCGGAQAQTEQSDLVRLAGSAGRVQRRLP